MMNMMKSRTSALFLANAAGMISGIIIGVVGACMLKKHMANRNSLKNRAKRAFKTIEDTIAM